MSQAEEEGCNRENTATVGSVRSWAERGLSFKDEETKLEGQGVEK